MVILETSFKELNKAIGKKLSQKELDETLSSLGFELDSVENDNLKIEITPDRPDLLSTQGLARLLKAYLGLKVETNYKIKKSNYKLIIDKSVEKIRPYTISAVVKNLNFDSEKIKEIINIQEKIHNTFARKRKKTSIGIYPLENIKFPITYLAKNKKEIKFRPLDCDNELTAEEILEIHPTGIKYSDLLKPYDKYPLFIDSTNKILSMPPIINAHELGKVTEKTKEIFIECSGHDLNSCEQVLNIIITTLADMGGEIYSVEHVYGNKKIIKPDLTPEIKEIKVEYVNKVLGTNFDSKKISLLLKKMNYSIKTISKEKLTVLIPKYRTDIWHEIDIVDDIIRAYGINNLEPTLPNVPSIAENLPENIYIDKLREVIVGLGFIESFTFGLTNRDDQFRKMNLKELNHIKLGTVKEMTINMVRLNLLPEILKLLVNNRSKEYPQKIFEINDVVIPDETQDVLCKNQTKLCCVIAHEKTNFTEIKQVLDYLAKVLDLNLNLKELNHSSFIEGRCASIIVNDLEIGYLGEINPIVLENFELLVPITALELNLETLIR